LLALSFTRCLVFTLLGLLRGAHVADYQPDYGAVAGPKFWGSLRGARWR
jgi:hypothetical protein